MSKPNFFIVGAPKCGTTSMYHYLRSHPDIFMPYDKERFWKTKEPNFYASDLELSPKVRIESHREYEVLFEPVQHESRIGEASVFYIYSASAAQNIKRDCPNAKIIIMLRSPVDLIRSFHQDCLRFGHENIADLAQAIAEEENRKQGQGIPINCAYPSLLIYTEIGAYLKHILRYQQAFGQSNIQIVLLEDLHNEPQQVYQDTLDFLEVDRSHRPEFEVHNKGTESSQADIEGQKLKLLILDKARPIFEVFRRLPPRQQEQVRRLFKQILPNSSSPATDPEFINTLYSRYRSDVDQLSQMLGRDLAHWCQPDV